MNGHATRCGKGLTEGKNDLVVRMFLKVSETRELLATERTEHGVVEGTLETPCTKRLGDVRGGWRRKEGDARVDKGW